MWTVYNLGLRVLPGRLCADDEDFYDLLSQIITFPSLLKVWKEKKSGIMVGYENASKTPLILWEHHHTRVLICRV